MKNKESHVSKRTETAELLKTNVMALFKWDDLQYGNFKFEMGLQYLEYFLHTYIDKPARENWKLRLSTSPVFWNWWKNHWSNRDEQFFNSLCKCGRVQCYLQSYKQIHSGMHLAASIQPNRIVLEESYHVMIQDLIKHEQESK